MKSDYPPIDSVSQYVKTVAQIKSGKEELGVTEDLLFRGHGDEDWKLLPTIARLDRRSTNLSLVKLEKLILKEFERGIPPLTEFDPSNKWDLMALAQHHGLPTRLMDWSYNALAALWFAVEYPPNNDKNGVVWVLAARTSDYINDVRTKDPFEVKKTRIFRSRVVSRRISAQSGIFSIHLIRKEDDKIFQFDTTKEYKEKLTKLVITPDKFAPIRKELSILGINNFSIYPDLDGFCKHLAWQFFRRGDEGK